MKINVCVFCAFVCVYMCVRAFCVFVCANLRTCVCVCACVRACVLRVHRVASANF